MAGERALSPQLASLCADSDDIHNALLQAGLLNTQDLGSLALATDAGEAARSLELSKEATVTFAEIFARAKAIVDGTHEARMSQMLDVLNAEGHLIMTRPRCDVHARGFWHRAVNVWVLCTSTCRVLLGQRGVGKDVDAHRWTCVCGRVPSGEHSMVAAVARLSTEFSIQAAPDEEIAMIFSTRCPKVITKGTFAGQQDSAWIDVYVASLAEEVPVEKLHLDVNAKQAAKYVSLPELEMAWERGDPDYVVPPDEYRARLQHYLKRAYKARGS